MSRLHRRFSFFIALLVLLPATAGLGQYSNYCSMGLPIEWQYTISQNLSLSDEVVLIEWCPNRLLPSTYEVPCRIAKVFKSKSGKYKIGMVIPVPDGQFAKDGELVLMVQHTHNFFRPWQDIDILSQAGIKYVEQIPADTESLPTRVLYYVNHLESPAQEVAADAYEQLESWSKYSPKRFYPALHELAAKQPRERIRKWVADPETRQYRLGLYGILLGFCGDASDGDLLERRIYQQGSLFELSTVGLTSGYLMIKKEAALEFLDRYKVRKKHVTSAELEALAEAYLFVSIHASSRIAPERLQQAGLRLRDRQVQLNDERLKVIDRQRQINESSSRM